MSTHTRELWPWKYSDHAFDSCGLVRIGEDLDTTRSVIELDPDVDLDAQLELELTLAVTPGLASEVGVPHDQIELLVVHRNPSSRSSVVLEKW